MDTLLGPLLDDLRACVCGSLADTLGGAIECACLIVPGSEAVADWCSCSGGSGCGMAWVRLDRMYASTRFPAQDSTATKCDTAVLAAVIEVGAFRCQPSSTGGGKVAPAPHLLTQAALVQSDDALALAAAILCCPSVTSRNFVLNNYTPRSGGACGGGVWTVTVQLSR